MDWRVSARGPARPSRRRPPGAPACPLSTSPLPGGRREGGAARLPVRPPRAVPNGRPDSFPLDMGKGSGRQSVGYLADIAVAGRGARRLRLLSSPLQGGGREGGPRRREPLSPGDRMFDAAPSRLAANSGGPCGGRRRRRPGRLAGAAKLSLEIFSGGTPGPRARASPPARKPQPRQALGRPRPAGNRKLSLGPWSALRAAPGAASFAEAGKGACHGQEIAARGPSGRGACVRGVWQAPCFQWLAPSRCGSRRGFRGVFGPFRPVPVRDSPG